MDAVKFCRDWHRMCDALECSKCQIGKVKDTYCSTFMAENPENAVAIIEKWSEENPLITNGQKVREMFPQIEGVSRTKDYVSTAFSRDWWDAEYKGE